MVHRPHCSTPIRRFVLQFHADTAAFVQKECSPVDQPLPASTKLDDATLVTLLREQPAAGVAALYDQYGRLIYSMALRIVGDAGAAEEVTQDVLLRCWKGIDRFQPSRGSFTSWLLTMAHHRGVDELRSRRSKQQQREVSDEHLAWIASSDPELDDAMLRDEVRGALDALPPPQREVIMLIFWGGLTRQEVAGQLGIPLGTVHTRLRLGMEKLRVIVGRLFDE